MKSCLRTLVHLRRVQRNPVLKKTTRRIVKGAVVSVFPSALNDVVFHHASLNIEEIVHVTQDAFVISIINTISKLSLI